jgi:hypothetical protein
MAAVPTRSDQPVREATPAADARRPTIAKQAKAQKTGHLSKNDD